MNGPASRFAVASSSLQMKGLLARARKGVWLALGVAAATHLSLTRVVAVRAERRAAKPLTTQFVKRRPRLTKPLELKKRPQPRRRSVHRKMVAVRPRAAGERATSIVHPVQIVESLSRPDVRVGRALSFRDGRLGPRAAAERIEAAREEKRVMDMSLEMVDIEALDTGRYHAMVIQNPDDKRDITGFLYLYVGYSVNGWSNSPDMHGGYFERPTALPRLVEAINRYTRVRATYKGAVAFTGSEIATTPWLYSSVDAVRAKPFRITKAEALSLGTYMTSGGFFFVEDAWPEIGGVCDRTARSMIEDALAAVNRSFRSDWTYQILPRSHPIYHCYFEFSGGPPRGLSRGSMYSREDGLEGVHINERLVAIFSGNDYEDIWAGPGTQFEYINPQRQYQFGVNLVVYALTQEGSITHRLMDSVR